MYTPKRRSSVSESAHRFTPSKRGQAALDALALGYDVQLPDYSFALLPRSVASEQALASIISTSATVEQLPRSASYGESSHRVTSGSSQGSSQRYPSSELSDHRRFARQGRPPRRGSILYSSSSTDVPFASLATRAESPSSIVDSRPSASSLQSDAPQYVLASPERPLTDPIHLEQASAALASLHTPRSLPYSPAQSGYTGRHTMARNKPSPPKLYIGTSNQCMEIGPAFPYISEPEIRDSRRPPRLDHTRAPSPRASPIRTTDPLSGTSPHNPSFERISRVPPSLRIDTERQTKEAPYSAHDARYLRTRSGPSPLSPVQPSPERDDQDSYQPLQQPSRAPVQYQHSTSGSHPSSSCQTSRLPTIDEPRYSGTQRAQFQPSALNSSNNSLRYSDRSQHSHFGASLRSSSPSQSSTSIPSPDRVPMRPSHHSLTQSLHNFAPPSSRKSVSPHTPSSSLPTSYSVDQDDEAFRVHPERAVIPRMESMLMLSACRHEAEGHWPNGGGNRSAGYEATGFSRDHARFPAGMNGFNGDPNQKGMTQLVYGTHGRELGERSTRTPPDTSYPYRFQAGPGSPNHPRTPGGTRGRQRSGSMHVLSPHRHGPPRHGSPPRQRQPHFQSPQRHRQRQRSASLMVQGLSPEAVKKLRVYETLKGREGGREESLREMVGVALPTSKGQPVNREAKAKNSGRSPRGSKRTLSPTEAATSIKPSPVSLETSAAPSCSRLVEVSVPPSPADIPLPPSPVHVFPLSPTQIALPPSPICSPELALSFVSSPAAKEPAPTTSPLVSSESFMKYRVSRGIQSPRPVRTRQNTVSGRVVPTFRLISSPEKADRLVLGPRLDTTGESLFRGLDEPSSRIDSLKPGPTIERILTPPPSFWSPPPLSAIVRTSVPLLPTAPAGPSRIPLRPMSVPPSGADEARLDEVRRAWSCELPVNVEVRVERSFAGDWSQCMVIDVSDEEEGDLVTDASPSEDESELEDEAEVEAERGESRPKDLEGSKVGECSGGVVGLLEGDEPGRDSAGAVEYIRSGSGASKYYLSKGGSSSGSGSGVNAVEAVQSAIVKLAMDNAGHGHAQRVQAMQTKFSTTPPPSAGLVARYPTHSYRQQKQPLDYPQHSRTSQMQASINAYFDPPTMHVVRSHSQHGGYTKSNPALDSLRSGLEKRVAASASAIEEAVRARSASPSLPNQAAQNATARSLPGLAHVLPPRLQRLQAMRTWTSPKVSLAQLEIPTFSQKSSSAQLPALPSLPTSPMPPPVAPQQLVTVPPSLPESLLDDTAKQPPPPPGTGDSASSHVPQSGPSTPASTGTKKRRPAHLDDIVVGQAPVPPAPATAPLARSKRGKHHKRRSADGASSKNHAGPIASTTKPSTASSSKPSGPAAGSSKESVTPNLSQPSVLVSSPPAKSKSRGKHSKRSPKPKKGAHPGKQDAPPIPPSPASAPVPVVPTIPPPRSIPAANVPPTSGTQENTTATKPARKKRYHKKFKTNKPDSTSTGS